MNKDVRWPGAYVKLFSVLALLVCSVEAEAGELNNVVDKIVSGPADQVGRVLAQATPDIHAVADLAPLLLPRLSASINDIDYSRDECLTEASILCSSRQEAVLARIAYIIKRSEPSALRTGLRRDFLAYLQQRLNRKTDGLDPLRVLAIAEDTVYSGGEICVGEDQFDVLNFLLRYAQHPEMVDGVPAEKVRRVLEPLMCDVCASIVDDQESAIARCEAVLGIKWGKRARGYAAFSKRINMEMGIEPVSASAQRELDAMTDEEIIERFREAVKPRLVGSGVVLGCVPGGLVGMHSAYKRLASKPDNIEACLELIEASPIHAYELLPWLCKPVPDNATQQQKAQQDKIIATLERLSIRAVDKREYIERVRDLILDNAQLEKTRRGHLQNASPHGTRRLVDLLLSFAVTPHWDTDSAAISTLKDLCALNSDTSLQIQQGLKDAIPKIREITFDDSTPDLANPKEELIHNIKICINAAQRLAEPQDTSE